MSGYRRKYSPPEEIRDLRELIVIAVEGDKTEIQYFEEWHQRIDNAAARIVLIPPEGKTDPRHVFDNLVSNQETGGPTEYWMVIDRDQWPLEMMTTISQECKNKNYHLCVSNPAFDFWLLLHFEKGNGIKPAESDKANSAVSECMKRLRSERYLIGFDKGFKRNQLALLMAKWRTAVKNAKELDTPNCKFFPKNKVGSTVYRLVERLSEFLPPQSKAE